MSFDTVKWRMKASGLKKIYIYTPHTQTHWNTYALKINLTTKTPSKGVRDIEKPKIQS